MGFSKFNRGSQFNTGSTKGYTYKKLEELYKEYGKDMTYPVRALYINESKKYGKSAVAVTDGFFISLPNHTVPDIEEIINTPELVDSINAGNVSITIHDYYSTKYEDTFYGIRWVEKKPEEKVPF